MLAGPPSRGGGPCAPELDPPKPVYSCLPPSLMAAFRCSLFVPLVISLGLACLVIKLSPCLAPLGFDDSDWSESRHAPTLAW